MDMSGHKTKEVGVGTHSLHEDAAEESQYNLQQYSTPSSKREVTYGAKVIVERDSRNDSEHKIEASPTLSFTYADPTQFLDFDDLLPLIGEFGFFQKLLFLYLLPFFFVAAYVYLGQLFMTLTPKEYYCYVQELHSFEEQERKSLSIPLEADGSYSHCLMYAANYTAIRFAKNRTQHGNTSLPTIPCNDGYVFSVKDMPFYTAAMEYGWVCDKINFACYAQIAFFLGAIVGSLGYGQYADSCGRVAALVSSCSLATVGSIFTALSKNFIAFFLLRFMVGASYATCFSMIFILVFEYVGPKYRVWLSNLSLAFFYTGSTCLLPWLALSLKDWKSFSILAGIPVVLGIFAFCLCPESARWLVSSGRHDNAIKILKNVARLNKKQVPSTVFEHFQYSCRLFEKEENEDRQFRVISLFKKSRLRRNVIMLIFIWMLISLVYDAHVRLPIFLTKNVFLMFTIACAVELPGYFILLWSIDFCGRRWCVCLFTALSGLCSLLAACIYSNAEEMIPLAMAARFFISMSRNIGFMWAAEILPTEARAQGLALMHALGFAGMAKSQPVVYLPYTSVPMKIIILGILAVIAGLCALMLPETCYQELPQSLSDADNFGSDQPCWLLPCLSKMRTRSRRSRRLWHTGSSLRTITMDEFRSKKFYRHALRIQTVRRQSMRNSNFEDADINEVEQSFIIYDNTKSEI